MRNNKQGHQFLQHAQAQMHYDLKLDPTLANFHQFSNAACDIIETGDAWAWGRGYIQCYYVQ